MYQDNSKTLWLYVKNDKLYLIKHIPKVKINLWENVQLFKQSQSNSLITEQIQIKTKNLIYFKY